VVIIGLWLGIIGYGILYAGVIKVGGGTCSLAQSFRGQCSPSTSTRSTSGASGTTVLGAAQAQQQQQSAAVPVTPAAAGNSGAFAP